MPDLLTKDLRGVTGFLNGQEGLHEREEKFYDHLLSIGKKAIIIDDLFQNPKNLNKIKKCDNIMLSTTGVYADKLRGLISAFEKMNYCPKKVMFVSENTAMIFCGIARELKKKHKIEFFFPDLIDFEEIIEIDWI
jgi:hypothetical protein